mmetsp:Transcript_28494/g.37266  ORF Transcript_28494/g.37266 Transcript_28494/m.37266 type:complete len:561 (+) Transcript_28494:308-1990(+)|eukprot:CAMPEP_0117749622 /NCGR_PEP_ID=MMETSP0947-20121206/9838_1 /TAXON_ID=44440 /ORGANISM="Chattonella subsalsa, Strain CCMP2191" /LENGTH=560 /DNA_ID=CAMNT_0005567545 /DNA_START=216 /DNA_END=1898 /DNA_ORIENTATION=-
MKSSVLQDMDKKSSSGTLDLDSLRKMHLEALTNSLLEKIVMLSKNRLKHRKQQCKEAFLEEAARKQIVDHFQILPQRYLFSIQDVEDVLLHMKLIEKINSTPNRLAIHVSDLNDNSNDDIFCFKRIIVCSVDKENLLCCISNALAQMGNRIIEADAMTTTTGFALDNFIVETRRNVILTSSKLEQQIEEYLHENDIDFASQSERISRPGCSDTKKGIAWKITQKAIQNYDSSTSPPDSSDDFPAPFPFDSSSPSTDSADGMKAYEYDFEAEDPKIKLQQLHIPFNDLIIQEKVGDGRQSFTHRAYWSGKMMAVKIFEIEPRDGSSIQDSYEKMTEFEREIAIVQNLRHPNVCQFYGIARSEPCTYAIVFEFVHGGTLTSLLRNSQRSYDFFQVARDIAEGMKYLHSKEIIHRDLKSGNILIDQAGNAKIADFGLSRFVKSGEELTAETGTYRWMAPEVIQHEPYSFAADVFSFAIVVWELLTRRVPYADLSPIQAAFAVVKNGYRLPLPARTPSRLATLIRRCWHPDQVERPLFPEIILSLDGIKQCIRQSLDEKSGPQK